MISLRSALDCTSSSLLAEYVFDAYSGISFRDSFCGGEYMLQSKWSLRSKLLAVEGLHVNVTYIVCGPDTIASDLSGAKVGGVAQRISEVATYASEVFLQNSCPSFGRITVLKIADKAIPEKFLRISSEKQLEPSGTYFFDQFSAVKRLLIGDISGFRQITVFLVPSLYTAGLTWRDGDAPIWLQVGRQANGKPPAPVTHVGSTLAHEYAHAFGIDHPDLEDFQYHNVNLTCKTCPPDGGPMSANCLGCNLANGGTAPWRRWLTSKQISRIKNSPYVQSGCK